MSPRLDHLTQHDLSDDCDVCRAQDVVAMALLPAAAAWEADNGLPRFSVALHGAAELLGAMLRDGITRDAVEAALGEGHRTPDLASGDETPIGCRAMGERVLACLGAD